MLRCLPILAVLALGACATQGEERPTIAGFQAQCATFGFTPGTDALAECVQRMVLAWNQHVDAVNGADIAALSAMPHQTSCYTTLGVTRCY